MANAHSPFFLSSLAIIKNKNLGENLRLISAIFFAVTFDFLFIDSVPNFMRNGKYRLPSLVKIERIR